MGRTIVAMGVLVVALVTVGAIGCNDKRQNAGAPAPAPSAQAISHVKREYTEALSKAKAWQPNANLQRVYRVYEGSLNPSEPVPLNFSFSSLVEPNKAYIVSVTEEGQTERKEDKLPFEINFVPIDVGNWEVDPDRALQIAEDNGGKQFRETHLAGYTVLVQLAQTNNHPLQWYVRYDTGDSSKKRYEVYLNAKTGKVDVQKETTLP